MIEGEKKEEKIEGCEQSTFIWAKEAIFSLGRSLRIKAGFMENKMNG